MRFTLSSREEDREEGDMATLFFSLEQKNAVTAVPFQMQDEERLLAFLDVVCVICVPHYFDDAHHALRRELRTQTWISINHISRCLCWPWRAGLSQDGQSHSALAWPIERASDILNRFFVDSDYETTVRWWKGKDADIIPWSLGLPSSGVREIVLRLRAWKEVWYRGATGMKEHSAEIGARPRASFHGAWLYPTLIVFMIHQACYEASRRGAE